MKKISRVLFPFCYLPVLRQLLTPFEPSGPSVNLMHFSQFICPFVVPLQNLHSFLQRSLCRAWINGKLKPLHIWTKEIMQSDLAKQGCSENSITSGPECARSHVFVQKAGFFLSKPFLLPFLYQQTNANWWQGSPFTNNKCSRRKEQAKGWFPVNLLMVYIPISHPEQQVLKAVCLWALQRYLLFSAICMESEKFKNCQPPDEAKSHMNHW